MNHSRRVNFSFLYATNYRTHDLHIVHLDRVYGPIPFRPSAASKVESLQELGA
jgi:hypothetical protein